MMRFYNSTSAKPFHSDHYSRLVSLIETCIVQQIKQTHAQLITTALISHPVSANKLHKLAACASLFYAHKLFDQIPHPDLFIYNAMIRAHSLLPHSCHISLVVFRSLTWDSGRLVEESQKVFQWAVDRDLYSWNTMISTYVGSGNMSQAKELFDGMQERNVVSWSTIIAGYVQVGCFMEALGFFHEMLQIGPKPNEYTLVSTLAACSNLVALDKGKWFHAYIGRGDIKMNERLLASIIGIGFAMHGMPNEAIDVFEQMKVEKVSPNKVAFIALLNACSHGYMVEEGNLCFRLMVSDYAITPEIVHYGCMVLSRSGLLKEAEDMISSMPMAPNVAIWGALLNACRIYKDVERGYRIGRIIEDMDPNHIGCHVLLSNIYSTSRRWNEARMLREKNKISRDRKKISGCSSIELKGTFHQFLVGDRSQPQRELLHDIDDEEDRVCFVCTQKLAIAFGLMNTANGTPIRIVKNLRVCGDCHQATKFISKVYNRVIIARDRTRYHRFKDGICSCEDYW
ncbi:hypothetical protein JHK82_025255 [Glycine max]|nr:hypothetical protein JHK85_025878 [Glycine max]KAG5013116.1 hypothetical protein JHK86_025377 [Glycine max]KAG5134067.1 hypothetical protein JHK82_025255 [Glycine max]